MNKIVEAVVKGQEVDKKELFNSVNDFELTRLRVSTEDILIRQRHTKMRFLRLMRNLRMILMIKNYWIENKNLSKHSRTQLRTLRKRRVQLRT